MKELSVKDILRFKKKYAENSENKLIENAITRCGINNVCFNRQTLIDNQSFFNLETSVGQVTDQKISWRCWLFSAVNLIRFNIAKNMNVDIKDVNLSINYISFFDKLEKTNTVYENLLNVENLDYNYLIKENFINYSECGRFSYFVNMVNKYGLVPASFMPETHDSNDSKQLNNILREKVKYDSSIIIDLRKKGKSISEIRRVKEKMLEENFNILSKVIGEPINEFLLEYTDKDGNNISLQLNPLEFKDKFLSINLNDFVALGSFEHYKKGYYKKYISNKREGSLDNSFEYINVPIDELKLSILKQLKTDMPVVINVPTEKMWNSKESILDSRNFDYENILGLPKMSKIQATNLRDRLTDHVVNIVGAHVVDEEIVRFKIENSWGMTKKISNF